MQKVFLTSSLSYLFFGIQLKVIFFWYNLLVFNLVTRSMPVRTNAFRVNAICILILIMIRFSYTKSLNKVETDGLNTEQVYGLCLLGENGFSFLLIRIPKLPRKSSSFLLFLACGDTESCSGPQVQENLAAISQLRGIKLVHQNIRGLLFKKDILETLFTSKQFIITLSETPLACINSELFRIPGFNFIHKNRITGREGGEVAMYLSDDLKWKRRTDLETDEIECIWVEFEIFIGKRFLVGFMYRPPDSSSYLRKDFNKNLNEMLTKVNNVSLEKFLLCTL